MEHVFEIIMQPLLPIIIVTAVVAVFAIYAYFASRRKNELLAWAAANGFNFSPDDDSEFDYKFPNFNCLRRGSGRYAKNVITGSVEGRTFFALDYHYTTGSGKSTQHHSFSAVIVQNPIWCKPLLIRPENFFDKLCEFVGFDDINFESAEFSRNFFVKSPDKKWAYDIIHPQAMDFLLKSPLFSIQLDTLYTIAWKDSKFKIDDFENALNIVHGLFQRVPGYVLELQKFQVKH
jgi:hypothetical protein